jgi:hypothetical protein
VTTSEYLLLIVFANSLSTYFSGDSLFGVEVTGV